MRCYRSHNRLIRAGSRLTAALALSGFVLLNFGFPLLQPAAPSGKDQSTPFPCQDRPCGCQSAEACFRACCCFSATERLAWAAAHHVQPPAELIAAAEKEEHEGTGHAKVARCCATSAHSSSTRGAAADACARHDHASSAAGHGEDADHGNADHHDDADRPAGGKAGRQVVFVIGPLAAQCRGLGALSMLAFSALPSVETVGYSFDWSPRGWLNFDSPRASSRAVPPLLRPPCA